MTEYTIKKNKSIYKRRKKSLCYFERDLKIDKWKYIRDKNPKITQKYQFVDGDELIDFDIEAD